MNLDVLGEVSFEDADIKFFINVLSYPEYEPVQVNFTEMNRYVKIEFIQSDENYTVMHKDSLSICPKKYLKSFDEHFIPGSTLCMD